MTESMLKPVKKESPDLPALTENTFLRYLSFTVLYIAQGIPEGMTYFGIPAWMAMNGKTPAEIGSFVAVVGIPWSFKILVAPLMDRYTFLAMGRRRPWVLFGQLGLIAAFIGLSQVPDPLNNLSLLMIAGFCVSFFGAFQDVATDGMAIDVIPVHQQARANGLMYGSKIAGTAASLAIGSWLINHYGFMTAILALSATVCLIMLVPLLMRERPGEKLLPWTKGSASNEALHLQLESWALIFKSLFKVFILRYSLLLGFISYLSGIAFSFMLTLLPIFTVQELGWTDQEYSQVYAVASLLGGLGGMFIGGALLDLFGKVRMLSVYFILLIVLTAAMAYAKIYWGNDSLVKGFMVLFAALYVFASVGIIAMSMQFSWKKVAASQFTLYMAIFNMGYATGPGLIGPIRDHFSWTNTMLFVSIVCAVCLAALQFMRIKKHMNKLEKLDRAVEESTVY